jgi:hypothetical protein
MNIESEIAPAIVPERRAEYRWNQATRALLGLAVFACLLVIPVAAHADIFTSLVTAVTNIGSIEAKISGNQSSEDSFNTNVVAPVKQLAALKNWLTQAESSYQGWFNSVKQVSVKSATLGNTSALENALRAGSSGGTGTGVSSSLFTSVYGAAPSASSVSPAVATRVDMSDSAAQEAMALAVASDNGSAQLLSAAQSLQQESANTAPGTADQVTAESQALQLQSNAMMHHLLASMIRQESSRLATETADVKTATTTHANTLQKMFGGNQ